MDDGGRDGDGSPLRVFRRLVPAGPTVRAHPFARPPLPGEADYSAVLRVVLVRVLRITGWTGLGVLAAREMSSYT